MKSIYINMDNKDFMYLKRLKRISGAKSWKEFVINCVMSVQADIENNIEHKK